MTTDTPRQTEQTPLERLHPAQRLSISLFEVPLKMGNLDNLIWGKDASHSYLVLKDAQSLEIISEIHGTTYDARYDRLAAGIAGSVRSLIGIGVQDFETFHLFNRAAQAIGLDDFFIRLRAKATDGSWRADLAHKENTLEDGAAQDVLPRWNALIRAAEAINKADLIYTPFGTPWRPGQNCHSVTSDMIEILGHTPPLGNRYARPGYDRRLSDTLHDLAAIAATSAATSAAPAAAETAIDKPAATAPFCEAVAEFKALIARTDTSIRIKSGISAEKALTSSVPISAPVSTSASTSASTSVSTSATLADTGHPRRRRNTAKTQG